MGLRLSKFESRGLSAALAMLILLGSVYVSSGLGIVPGSAHPEIALDVCHPLQTFNLVSKVLITRPDSGFPRPALDVRGTIPEQPTIRIISLSFAPDPPPPKALI
jgi:hypothetical protein